MYPLYSIHYTNNTEYRKCIRNVFNMKQEIYHHKINDIETKNNELIDDETRDELSYDDESASKLLDYVYDITKKHPLCYKLYECAAAKMISTDMSTGLAVLFSYDYFELFHKCMICYIITPELFTNNCYEYITMYNYLNK